MISRFPAVTALIKERIFGPEPVGKAQAAVLQGGTAAELGGRQGTPHFGMKGDPAVSYTGLVSSPQSFQGNPQMGSSPRPTVQNYPALPSATAPEALPTWFSDWTDTAGMLG